MTTRTFAACVAMAASLATVAAAAPGMAETAPSATHMLTPAATARNFYAWYVGAINDDKVAVNDTVRYPRFVTRTLRDKVRRLMNAPDGLDADYYIQAQDYDDDWATQIEATALPSPVAGKARVAVRLGAKSATPHRLIVDLTLEGGAWKIAEITRG